jgi:hypothetical protein
MADDRLTDTQAAALRWMVGGYLRLGRDTWAPCRNPQIRIRRRVVDALVSLGFARRGTEPMTGAPIALITPAGRIIARTLAALERGRREASERQRSER